MTVKYTHPNRVADVKRTELPPNPYITGYGPKIPSSAKIRYRSDTGERWYRVYVMCYGNSGSAYIRVAGQDLFLDNDTEFKMSGRLNGPWIAYGDYFRR